MTLQDRDYDGIADIHDKEPDKFNVTKSNQGKPKFPTAGTVDPAFQPDVPNIVFLGMRPMSSPEAKNWFKFASTRGGVEKQAYDRFVAAIVKLGIPKSKAQAVWSDAVDWVQTVGSSTSDPTNYISVLDPSLYKDTTATGKKYGTSQLDQKVTTSYSTSSAAQDITTAYKTELGMEAGKKDILAYQEAVNAAAAKEPTVTQQMTTTSAPTKAAPMGVTKIDTKTSTGFDPNRFAIEYARNNPEYAENFAAKNFMNLIEQALTNPTRIGQVVQ